MVPGYRSTAVAWVEAGGVYAIADIRGGCEYGEAWHRAGMRETKQNVFDDFLAAADYLQDNRYCSPATLGIEGGSNGGILVGACITQAPARFSSAVCTAPVLDMVRFDRMPGGQISCGELGNPNIAEDFEFLYPYSPYHHVVAGTEYPAVLFTVFESDARAAPCTPGKCARPTAGNHVKQPILYQRSPSRTCGPITQPGHRTQRRYHRLPRPSTRSHLHGDP